MSNVQTTLVAHGVVCLKPGHRYELSGEQIVQFTHMHGSVLRGGTTNEEVLQMLIHRMKILDELHPCAENKQGIAKMEEALAAFEARTQRVTAERIAQQQQEVSTN